MKGSRSSFKICKSSRYEFFTKKRLLRDIIRYSDSEILLKTAVANILGAVAQAFKPKRC